MSTATVIDFPHSHVLFVAADITAIAKIYGKAVERDGESFMGIEKINVDFTMKNARFKVKDHVNTQNVLGKCLSLPIHFLRFSLLTR